MDFYNNLSGLNLGYTQKRSLGKPGSFRTFTGTYIRFGKSWRQGKGGKPWYDKKALFRNLDSLDHRFGADHIWLDWVPEFNGLKEGDKVRLSGVVQEYNCPGSDGRYSRINTKLTHLRDIEKL